MDFNTFKISFDENEPDVEVEFDEKEKAKLIGHYNNAEMNQFHLVLIQKVLANKSFTLDDHQIITNLLPIITSINFDNFNIESDEDIIRFAKIVYQFFYLIDIEEFGETRF